MLLLFFIAFAFSCYPQSRWLCDNPCDNWQCDDPVCSTICEPICNTSCVCFNPDTNSSYPKHCDARCPPDQCASDACPTCETICTACKINYHALCEQTSCQWKCIEDPACPKPTCEPISTTITCAEPRCELQSEMPACMYNTGIRFSLF
jgi:hypothetical protein